MHIFLMFLMLMIVAPTHASDECTVNGLTLNLALATIKIAAGSNLYIVFPDNSRLILGGIGGHYKNRNRHAGRDGETMLSADDAAEWKDIIQDLKLKEEVWNPPRQRRSTKKIN